MEVDDAFRTCEGALREIPTRKLNQGHGHEVNLQFVALVVVRCCRVSSSASESSEVKDVTLE